MSLEKCSQKLPCCYLLKEYALNVLKHIKSAWSCSGNMTWVFLRNVGTLALYMFV